jgi:hypothetical protein
MKKSLLLNLAFVALVTLNACKKDEKDAVTPEPTETEGQFVRLFVSDQDLVNYYIINPQKGTHESQAGQFSNGSLYSSPSGRFVSVINSGSNFASFFDSGIESHNDHAHVKGTPKWALTTASGTTPVHYYGRGDDMLIFNDGDGSISHFKESTLHTESNARTFSVGVAHHGAPALFNNNTIAVTEKDGSAAGTLPERVKVVDTDGNTLHSSTIQTGGLHGEAGNGELVLFGSTDGILLVRKNGAQELINYPASFATNWLGSIYYGKECHQFVGFKSKYGLYKIDSIAKTVTAIEENTTLFSATFDWQGHHLIVLYTDGTVKVLDGNNFSVIVTKNLGVNFPASGSKGNPVVASTEDYVYITDGINGKITMYKKSNLDKVKEISLPGKPSKIALMGSMAKEDDNH